jgi:alpha-glucosidase
MNHRQTNKVFILSVILLTGSLNFIRSQEPSIYKILSPDQQIECAVMIGQDIRYTVSLNGRSILDPSPISMTLSEGRVLGENLRVADVHRRTILQEIRPEVLVKSTIITDYCNELTLSFTGYAVIFRTYDNGVAYRFRTDLKGNVTVVSEKAEFNFAGNPDVYFPAEDSFFSHNERTYLHTSLDSLPAGRLASLPVLIAAEGVNVLIEESALRDYPGMWVKTGGSSKLTAVFPPYALESRLRENSDRDVPVTQSADFIAKTWANRSFPWRIMAIAREDGDLITNQLVYQLADATEIKDPSWIRPGKVAWDWWNANNIYGVDLRAGINTETYKYYIDFASEFGIEYIILDEGWYRLGDLLDVVPDMDVEALIDYGKQKNVGVILWVVWKTLDDQLEVALDQFEKWGAEGIKVDFMQRDDQEMVNFYWKIAAEAAKRHMLVDFHGAYKPAGLRRAFPNVITREGVKGFEHNKWSRDITPTHNLTLPFIRMVPGPMDYTPGAMINAQPRNFRDIFTRPMGMGTRAHQVAMYIVYESPLQMMADSPSNYLKERECTEFIAKIPTTWDETRVFKAAVGEYLVLARKNGNLWYLGAMTNEAARNFTVDLSFLGEGKYIAEIIEDGINADRYGSDYRKRVQSVSQVDTLTITLAPGGGWAGIFKREISDP